MRDPLDPTARQLEVLTSVARHIADNGYPPTLRELGEALGIISTNAVSDNLKALARKGLLTRLPLKSRTMKLTAAGKLAVEGRQ